MTSSRLKRAVLAAVFALVTGGTALSAAADERAACVDPADGDCAAAPAAQSPETAEERKQRETGELCALLMGAADAYGVPPDFFIRLIWKESRFNAGAVSPVGAQGIAQFMPGTARLRGLKNPFDREEALYASASFLRDMRDRFGSWGLAAIGYNGGPNRVDPLVQGSGGLPYETIDYVYAITGRTHHYWAERARRARGITVGEPLKPAVPEPNPARAEAQSDAPDIPATGAESAAAAADGGEAGPEAQRVADRGKGRALMLAALNDPTVIGLPIPADQQMPAPRPDYEPRVDCPVLVARLGRARDIAPPVGGGPTLWGAQVAGHPKRSVAMRQYTRIKDQLPRDLVARGPRIIVRRFAARGRLPIHAVMFAAGSHSEAKAMCKRIAKALAPCVVVKNR